MTIPLLKASILLLSWLVGGQAQQQPCDNPAWQPEHLGEIIASLKGTVDEPVPSVDTMESIAFHYSGRCFQVIALRWDGGLEGGIVVLDLGLKDPIASPLLEESYPGAYRLQALTEVRFMFVWVPGRGSGVLEEEAVVMRPFARTWAHVLTLTATRKLYPGGLPDETFPSGAPIDISSDFSVKGDTLMISRIDRIGGTTRRSVSRIVLP